MLFSTGAEDFAKLRFLRTTIAETEVSLGKIVTFVVVFIVVISVIYWSVVLAAYIFQRKVIYKPLQYLAGSQIQFQQGHPGMEEIFIKTRDNTKLHGYFWLVDKFENNEVYGQNKSYSQAVKYEQYVQEPLLANSDKYNQEVQQKTAQIKSALPPVQRLGSWNTKLQLQDVVLLYFHGNGGNIQTRLAWLRKAHQQLGVGVCMVDYRGYGASEGTPSEEALISDAKEILAFVKNKLKEKNQHYYKLVLMGESLGTAIAFMLAAEEQPDGLILQSAFSSLAEVLQYNLPLLPIKLILLDKYNAMARASLLSQGVPVLFIHGSEDKLIPLRLAKQLYSKLQNRKYFKTIAGSGHNDLAQFCSIYYWRCIQEFLIRECFGQINGDQSNLFSNFDTENQFEIE